MGRESERKLALDLINTLIQAYDIKGMDDVKSMISDLVGALRICSITLSPSHIFIIITLNVCSYLKRQ